MLKKVHVYGINVESPLMSCTHRTSFRCSVLALYTFSKVLATEHIGRVMVAAPKTITVPEKSFPIQVIGAISPYPTLVRVTRHHHMDCGML